MLKKFKTIVLSRFKRENQEDWVEVRRKICKACPYNSKNQAKVKFKKRVLIYLSDFYSFITGNKEKDNLGNCTACESCSVAFKTLEPYEHCPEEKWNYILD
jgi:protein-arginine kinase activator protein McsA